MSGLCYSCASRFGTFNKELGCKNCGFAFCKKCLNKKAAVPKLDNKSAAVCDKCFNILTRRVSGSDAAAKFEPPDALLRRLAALEQSKNSVPQTAAASAGSSKKKSQPPTTHRGLSQEDAAMVERLERLKADRRSETSVPSQSDIEARLAKLKEDNKPPVVSSDRELSDRLARSRGQNAASSAQPFVFPVDRRSEQQQIDSLLEEINGEVMIDDRLTAGSVSDIQDRLNKLKSGDTQNNINEPPVDSSTVPQRPPNALNILPSEPSSSSSSRPHGEPSWSEFDQVMRDAAAEAQADADQAIEGMKKDKELWNRVQQLKDARHSKRNSDDNNVDSDNPDVDALSISSNDDSDAAAGRVITQVMEESALDERCRDELSAVSGSASSVSKANVSRSDQRPVANGDDEDLPWCCICNNDATLRCAGCDGDLYCQRCYREGHNRFEMKDHHTAPFSSATRRSS